MSLRNVSCLSSGIVSAFNYSIFALNASLPTYVIRVQWLWCEHTVSETEIMLTTVSRMGQSMHIMYHGAWYLAYLPYSVPRPPNAHNALNNFRNCFSVGEQGAVQWNCRPLPFPESCLSGHDTTFESLLHFLGPQLVPDLWSSDGSRRDNHYYTGKMDLSHSCASVWT
jgi:hypothetical protein